MQKKMKAAILYNINDLRYEEIDIPVISDEEALVKVRSSGICSSDIYRVKSKGAYHYPIILGHEFCGEIFEIKSSFKKLSSGTKVVVFPLIPCKKCYFCEIGEFAQCDNYNYLGSRSNGGFAEYVKVPVWNLIPLPENIDFDEGALTEPISVALHAVRRFGVDIGDKTAVFGCGPIGLAVAQWLRIYGAEKIFLVDIQQKKLEYAEKIFGFNETINAKYKDPVKEILDRTNGLGVDLCIETAGTPITFEQCIRAVRKFGKLVFLGNINSDVILPQKTVSQILRNQIIMTGSWNSYISNLPKNEWKIVLDYISTKKFDAKSLISHRFKLEDCNKAFDMMFAQREFFNKVLFVFK